MSFLVEWNENENSQGFKPNLPHGSSGGDGNMGYRNKIAILSKERHAIIKDMTYGELVKWYQNTLCENQEFDADDKYVPCYELSEELFDMGKYCELTVRKFKRQIFSKIRTDNQFNTEGEFYIIGKEGLLEIIEQQRLTVVKYYEAIADPAKRAPFFSMTAEQHIKEQIQEWDNEYCRPYSLDDETPVVVSSWRYEYTIFELVRLLKTIDYEKYEVCITSW